MADINALRIMGYSAVGDGGESVYKRIGGPASNAWNFQSADGAYWELVVNDLVNPLQLGAVGDGSTDDTTAFQNAIDYPGSSGIIVTATANNYRIVGSITLTNEKNVISFDNAEIFVDPSADYLGAIKCADDNIISGLRFIGTGIDNGTSGGTGSENAAAIRGTGCKNVTIRDCFFDSFDLNEADDGIIGFYNAKVIKVLNNRFGINNQSGTDVNLSYRTGDCLIDGNYSESGNDKFAFISSVDSSVRDANTEVTHTDHITITNNIYLKGGATGNTDVGRHGIAVHYDGGSTYCTISDNILVNGSRHGIYLRGDNTVGGNTGPDIVKNNIIRYFGGGEPIGQDYGYNSGIKLEVTKGAIVEGNLIEQCGYYPDGTVRGVDPAAGIEIIRAARNVIVSDNIVQNCSHSGICFWPTSGVSEGTYNIDKIIITNNICRNNARETDNGAEITIGNRTSNTIIIGGFIIDGNIVESEINERFLMSVNGLGQGTPPLDAIIQNNLFVGHYDAGANQVGLAFSDDNFSNFLATGNQFRNLYYGLGPRNIAVGGGLTDPWSSLSYSEHREMGTTFRFSHNTFRDCLQAFIFKYTAGGRFGIVSPTNQFSNVTNLPHTTYTTGFDRTYFGEVIGKDASDNDIIEFWADGPPTASEQQYAGDRVRNNNTAIGYEGWICTAAGTPGTWQPYGVLGSTALTYETRAAAIAAYIPTDIDSLKLMGYTTSGDGGEATYKRLGVANTNAWNFQSADGAYWELCSQIVSPKMFGAAGDGTTSDDSALQDALDFCNETGTPFIAHAGDTYLFSNGGVSIDRTTSSYEMVLDFAGATILTDNSSGITMPDTPTAFLTTTLDTELARDDVYLDLGAVTNANGSIEPGDLIYINNPANSSGTVSSPHFYTAVELDGANVYIEGTVVADITNTQITSSGANADFSDVTVSAYKLGPKTVITNLNMEIANNNTGTGSNGLGIRAVDKFILTNSTFSGNTRNQVNIQYCNDVDVGSCTFGGMGYVEKNSNYDNIAGAPDSLSYGYGLIVFRSCRALVHDCIGKRGWHSIDFSRGMMKAQVDNCIFERNAFGVSTHEGSWHIAVRNCRFEGGSAVLMTRMAYGLVENCYFKGMKEHAISYSAGVWDLHIAGNRFEYIPNVGGSYSALYNASNATTDVPDYGVRSASHERSFVFMNNSITGDCRVYTGQKAWSNSAKLVVQGNNFERSTLIQVHPLLYTIIQGNVATDIQNQFMFTISIQSDYDPYIICSQNSHLRGTDTFAGSAQFVFSIGSNTTPVVEVFNNYSALAHVIRFNSDFTIDRVIGNVCVGDRIVLNTGTITDCINNCYDIGLETVANTIQHSNNNIQLTSTT
jgi:hypothetical protein